MTLRRDPEKVRAWLGRSREKAISRALGREGQSSTSLRRTATAPSDFRDDEGRHIRKATQAEYARANGGKVASRKKGLSGVRPNAAWSRNLGPCAMCPPRRAGQRPRQGHHVLPKQHIRAYVEGLRLPEADGRKLLRKLLSDQRNRMPLCAGTFGCHQQFEDGPLVIPRSVVPESAWEFAAELGDRYVARLERTYP